MTVLRYVFIAFEVVLLFNLLIAVHELVHGEFDVAVHAHRPLGDLDAGRDEPRPPRPAL